MLNIKKLFQDNHIDYTVNKGWVQITCPFCSDRGKHMGYNIENKYFHCWRCGYHGFWSTIKKLIPGRVFLSDYDGFERTVIQLEKERPRRVKLPGSEKPTKKHIDYLHTRGFNNIDYLIEKYKLRFTDHIDDDPFRIIFPVLENERVLSYQGRDITGKSKMKYKAAENEKSIRDLKDCLFNIDNCKKDSVLVLEGVLDVLKFGDNSLGTFGTSVTRKQIEQLLRFDHIMILFDPEPEAQQKSKKLGCELAALGIDVEILELKNGDVGDMTKEEVVELKNILNFF